MRGPVFIKVVVRWTTNDVLAQTESMLKIRYGK
jgi:hypothetical protein